MSRRAFTLPFRAIAPSTSKFASQWTCRRCLATQAEVPSTAQSDTVPPNYDPTLPFSQRIGPDGQHYNLKKSDRMLKKPLKQRLPPQYLQHSTSEILHESEKAMRQESVKHKKLVGVVVSSGRMKKTVTVRVNGQKWNKRIGKVSDGQYEH
jgi:small subunit ribosomal protein S17